MKKKRLTFKRNGSGRRRREEVYNLYEWYLVSLKRYDMDHTECLPDAFHYSSPPSPPSDMFYWPWYIVYRIRGINPSPLLKRPKKDQKRRLDTRVKIHERKSDIYIWRLVKSNKLYHRAGYEETDISNILLRVVGKIKIHCTKKKHETSGVWWTKIKINCTKKRKSNVWRLVK